MPVWRRQYSAENEKLINQSHGGINGEGVAQ